MLPLAPSIRLKDEWLRQLVSALELVPIAGQAY
jgi:hypothetical protein